MEESSIPAEAIASRRRYDSPARRKKSAQTRERIIDASVELVHGFATWDFRDLTFRAVAERAGVGERTVYRHFPTERLLQDAVMARLERDAGIAYEEVDLANLADVTGRLFASLQRFSVDSVALGTDDPTFASVDRRRHDALLRAVSEAAPQWSELQHRAAAGLLDVLWFLPAYERLIGAWNLSDAEASAAIRWLIGKVVSTIADGEPPLPQ